jgi:hypothetical protein
MKAEGKGQPRLPEVLSFLLPLAIGLTYPLQVTLSSSGGGALALGVTALLVGSALIQHKEQPPAERKRARPHGLDLLVFAIVIQGLVSVVISWMAFGPAAVGGTIPVLFLLIQGGLLYVHFAHLAERRHVQAFLYGMLAMGIASGVFFAYDSVSKLAFGVATPYSIKAHAYSYATLPAGTEISNFRIDAAYRSMGLLERHSTSALWVVLGFVSSLGVMRQNRGGWAWPLALVVLLLSQNFTSLLVFVAVTTVLFRGSMSLTRFALIAGCLLGLVLLFDASRARLFWDVASEIMEYRLAALTPFGSPLAEGEVTGILQREWARYATEVLLRPHHLIVGMGLGSNPFYGTSGDFGVTESMMRLGIPLWALFTVTVGRFTASVARRTWRHGGRAHVGVRTHWEVGAGLLLAIWMMDLHYSAWIYKSVFPILFFGLALARRSPYAPEPAEPDAASHFVSTRQLGR